ncbi:hypothetical protein PoB_007554200 [Plakobranchus ocellatus]|uniref:Transformer n=1 Tax=Plakobranchus ocellatus TaxID=259542 RepID=A0AAV4DXI1_9GAST|nr:hypothetical protein PoB_007554200 [Plakobranchus ocellatus]
MDDGGGGAVGCDDGTSSSNSKRRRRRREGVKRRKGSSSNSDQESRAPDSRKPRKNGNVEEVEFGSAPSPHQGVLRLSGPPTGQGAGGRAQNRDRRIPTDLRADSLSTVSTTPGRLIKKLMLPRVGGLGHVRPCPPLTARSSLYNRYSTDTAAPPAPAANDGGRRQNSEFCNY